MRWIRTWVGRQTDGSRSRGQRHTVIESQQCQIVLEVKVTELTQDGSQNEPGFRLSGGIAIVVFTKRDFNQRPKKSVDEQYVGMYNV